MSEAQKLPLFVSASHLSGLQLRAYKRSSSSFTPSHSSTIKVKGNHSVPTVRATLYNSNSTFGEDPHPCNPFSYELCAESDPNNEYDLVGGNGASHHIAEDKTDIVEKLKRSMISCQEEEHITFDEDFSEPGKPDVEEMFLDGLSYPSHALDWCSTEAKSNTPLNDSENGGHVCNSETDLQMKRVEKNFVDTFRMSSPYINAHQGLIFVIHIPAALLQENMFASVMEDIALMRVVGIKLVLVLDPQGLINDRLKRENLSSQFVDGLRITDSKTMQIVKEMSGSMRFEVECALAKGVTNMPSHKNISVVSGNFFSAQPVGIINGQDFGNTGKIRRIDVDSIAKRLDQGDIIVLSNIASSPSGQQFNCKAEEVAAECAAQLKAEKLIFMCGGETLYDRRSGHTIPNLSLKSASRYLKRQSHLLPDEFRSSLEQSINALDRGVRRAHILNRFMNGVLLMEVFHRDGVGLMVSRDLYEGFRPARTTDVNGVKAIIRPLEDKGILKHRSRNMLERDIEKFVVIERDGMIIACLSLSVIEEDPTWAELGCVAVHQNYRKLGKGDAMLGFTERMAHEKGVRNLFVLSTQSFDWFHERGFKEVSVDDLPKSRQEVYDRSRLSKIFYKVLHGSRAVDEAEVLKHL